MTDSSAPAERLWHELGAELRRFIERRVSDPQSAGDLLQEVFLRIHDRLESLSDTDRLYAWVYTIARNVIVDHYRRKSVPSIAESTPVVSEPVSEQNLNGEVAGWLGAMVDQLPPAYREAVRLSEIEGWRQADVAEQLGLSVSGAKSRIQRGRELLKETLLECCHFDMDRRGNIVGYHRRSRDQGCCGSSE